MSFARRPGVRGRLTNALPALAGWGVLAVGLTTALVVVARVHWYPQLDLAMTELRVRDVASAHPPSIGLIGRIGTLTQRGSHPGPISFYMLWPFYELFGGTAWALEAASVCLHGLAAAIAIVVAQRRGGATMALAVAVMLACLMTFLGPSLLIQPWNPYLPLIWWVAFLFAAWSTMCGDFPMLPIAAWAGTVCVQTHISYALLIAGVGLLVVARTWVLARRARSDSITRRRIGIWSAVAIAVVVALWIPPLVQQLSGSSSNGNLDIIFRYFRSPPEASIGFATGARLMLVHLNPWTLVRGGLGTMSGSILPGLSLLAAWCAGAVFAVRTKQRQLALLDVALAVALVCCVGSASRIFGRVFFYLLLWGWALCAMMILATAWAGYVVARQYLAGARGPFLRAASNVVLVILLVAFGARFVSQASAAQVGPGDEQSKELGALVSGTLDALRRGDVPGGGKSGRYLIAYDDPFQLGSQAFGLLDELERAGFRVGMPATFSVFVEPHRVLEPKRATAEVLLVVGPSIGAWQSRPGVHRVAYVGSATPFGQERFAELSSQVRAQLRGAGLSDLIHEITDNLFLLATDTRLPAPTVDLVTKMLRISQPAAVFVGSVQAFAAPGG